MNQNPVKQVSPQPEPPAKKLAIRVSQERSKREPMPCTWLLWL